MANRKCSNAGSFFSFSHDTGDAADYFFFSSSAAGAAIHLFSHFALFLFFFYYFSSFTFILLQTIFKSKNDSFKIHFSWDQYLEINWLQWNSG